MDFPCHKLPREKWCDRFSLGDFMGHTCLPAHDQTKEEWLGLFKLTEELGEVQQLVGKAGACPVGEHWDGKGPIRRRLPAEIADLRAALTYFELMNGLPRDTVRESLKLDLFKRWGLSGVATSTTPPVTPTLPETTQPLVGSSAMGRSTNTNAEDAT